MPRKLTKNADAAADLRAARELRCEFRYAIAGMSPFDKLLLADILRRYSENGGGERLALASAFETSIALNREDLLVIDADEYNRLLKRLQEAEAFRKKVTVMPVRDAA